MSVDVFGLHCSALSTARLVGFRAREVLSQPFELDVFFTVPEGTDVRSAIGSAATIAAVREDSTPLMSWHGVLVRMRLLHQTHERALYQGLVVPKLWLLRHHVRSHVQTKKGQKVKDFTGATLAAADLCDGTDFKFTIDDGRYPEEEFVCQYRESHLAFVQRWLEREGLYYYFEHAAETSGDPLMTVIDEKGEYKALRDDGIVRYFPDPSGDQAGAECLQDLHVDVQLLPASVTIADHNYANPTVPVSGDGTVLSNGRGVMHEYGYRVFDSGQATRLAEVKAQSIACRELTLHARGNYLGLRAGYDFEVEDGPDEYPSKYLAIEVTHRGTVAATSADVLALTGLGITHTYEVEVVAIPREVQFRAPQTTPWPRIDGYEHGAVDGPADAIYAQIDDQGRYLVRFHFDTADLPDGSTSTYLRMMQPHGGNPEGFHFPLRKGTEVLVGFRGGDPDRPIIAGVVPDAHRPSTVTSRNHTQNVIRTGGRNHIVIEDQDGQQSIDIYTPQQETNFYLGHPRRHAFATPPDTPGSDITITAVDCAAYLNTEGNAGFVVGGDWWQNVGVNYYLDVCGNGKEHFVGNYILNTDGTSTEFYNSTRATTTKSGRTDTVQAGGVTQTIEGGGWHQHVTGASDQTIEGTLGIEVSGATTSKLKGGWTVEETPGVVWEIGGDGVEIHTGKEFAVTAPKIELHATNWFHFEGHKEEYIGNLLEIVGAEEIIALATALHASTSAMHFTGFALHLAGPHYDNHLAHVEHGVAHLKEAVTELKNTATIVNVAVFVKIG
jgi:type VI secretion system secreted protein VgrG